MPRYPGLHDAAHTFSRLTPFHARVSDLCDRFAPGTADRAALEGVVAALDRAATHFTGRTDFFVAWDAGVPPPPRRTP